MVHSDQGAVAVCAWYRPPEPGEVDTISSFDKEWREISASCIGTIAVGDINVHSCRWLRYSSGESAEGTALELVSRDLGAKQVVKSPTRGDYLLDLVISDIEGVRAEVVPGVSDHDIVIASLELTVPQSESFTRTVWDYRGADWSRLSGELMETDWSFIGSLGASEAAQEFTSCILSCAERSIPQRTLKERKSTHPWLTVRAVKAVQEKHVARGSVHEAAAVLDCSQVLFEERLKFQQRACSELSKLSKGSKLY
jgi:hypothetical protein